jgi:hypothetical protein
MDHGIFCLGLFSSSQIEEFRRESGHKWMTVLSEFSAPQMRMPVTVEGSKDSASSVSRMQCITKPFDFLLCQL